MQKSGGKVPGYTTASNVTVFITRKDLAELTVRIMLSHATLAADGRIHLP